jgi:hypothetical protein
LPVLANSVWASAAAHLEAPLLGHLTIDVGATARALERLVCFSSATALAAALLVDRSRAEIGLHALGITLLVAAGVNIWISGDPTAASEGADAAVLSLLVALACGYLAIERFETRRGRQSHAGTRLIAMLVVCAAAMIASAWIILAYGGLPMGMAAIVGALCFMGIIGVRRLGLGMGSAAAVAILVFVGMGIVAFNGRPGGSLLLALTGTPPYVADMARRMLGDASFLGAGAGTADLISGLYRGFDDPPTFKIPSTAAALIVELGWPAAAVLLLGVFISIVFLARKALLRGRDSVYAALGTSTIASLTILIFVNDGTRAAGLDIAIAGLLGLALAQSESRRA